MDIETLRKIQETEKALRIHNISVSTHEASEQVSQDVYVGGTKVPTFEDVSQSAGDILLKQKEEAYQQSRQQQREVTKMDDQQTKEVQNKINEQAQLISSQARMIYELQGVVNDIIREIKKMQTSVPTKNPSERQVVLKAEDKQEHPRSGGYTSADVSIDKIFYAGNK